LKRLRCESDFQGFPLPRPQRLPFIMLLLMLLLLALTVQQWAASDGAKVVSFTANGQWGPQTAVSNESLCVDRMMCTPTNLTWLPAYPVPPGPGGLYTNETACAALVSKGITKIYFHGDSYMRQIYAALLITLTGDYRGGSLQDAKRVPECTYHKQFNEKRCGTRELNHYGVVCNGKVVLDPLLVGLGDLNLCSKSNGSVVLWSFGNYKLAKGGRYGVNNATAYSEIFENGVCKQLNSTAFVHDTLHSGRPIAQVRSGKRKSGWPRCLLCLTVFSSFFRVPYDHIAHVLRLVGLHALPPARGLRRRARGERVQLQPRHARLLRRGQPLRARQLHRRVRGWGGGAHRHLGLPIP